MSAALNHAAGIEYENFVGVANRAQAMRDLKKANQQLQRELNRKDKALAEAAALLILQKKFNAYLEGADE